MGEDTSQIEREITAERRELGRNLNELQDKAKELADWRAHYRNHTAIALSLAAGAGVLAGALVSGRRLGVVASREPAEPPHQLWGAPQHSEFRSQVKHQVGQLWHQVVYALLGVVTAKAVDIISQRVPQFREEFDRQGGDTSWRSRPTSVH